MVTAAGIMAQWHARHRVKGRKASHITKNREVCLQQERRVESALSPCAPFPLVACKPCQPEPAML